MHSFRKQTNKELAEFIAKLLCQSISTNNTSNSSRQCKTAMNKAWYLINKARKKLGIL